MSVPEVDRLGVLTTTAKVVERSRYVHIDETAIAGQAPGLARRITVPDWHQHTPMVDIGEQTANWLLVLDALNFSFWGESRWRVERGGTKLDGYYALGAALARALDEGVPIANADYLANITLAELAHVLRGENEIPMLDRRVENLHEVGEWLRMSFNGSFARAIESCNHSAVRLVELVVGNLWSFDDIALYQAGEVRFYKRAQLLVSDLHGAFRGEGLGRFDDLDQLTAFADYKLPQVLRHMGILEYIASLDERVDNRFLFPAGSREDTEIRAHTVWAVELLRRELARHGTNIRAFEIDWWLWQEGQRLAGQMKPYHLTRTIYF